MILNKSRNKKLSYKLRYQFRNNNPLDVADGRRLRPRVVLHFLKNNIFFNLTCRLKKDPFLYATVFWLSCGSKKFSIPQYRGSSKTSYIANYSLGILVAQKIHHLNLSRWIKYTIVFKSFGNHFQIFLKAFKKRYRRRFNLLDLTPISLNGCRLKKVRRV